MIGNIMPVGSNTSLLGSLTTQSSVVLDWSSIYPDQVGIWFKFHSCTATPSALVWIEQSHDTQDDNFRMPVGADSQTVTNSHVNIFTASATYMKYAKVCMKVWNATPTSTASCYIFTQEDY